jgi:ABC-type dipeptide/oligopeptide/nickel transport system permease component
MIAYLIRRLLLMIPTLIGITFLVFMLIALSPGGVGAALRFAGGSGQSGQDARAQQAYLEDRYGLDDPAIVQYGRWLARISPIKFGARDQRDRAGTIIRAPKALKEPPLLGTMYGSRDRLAQPAQVTPIELSGDAEEANRAYRSASNAYQSARLDYISAQTDVRVTLNAWGSAQGIRGVLNAKGKLNSSKLRGLKLDASAPAPEAVSSLGADAEARYRDARDAALAAYERAIKAFNAAQAARDQLANVYAAEPYPEVGFWVIPGVLSLGPPDFGHSHSRSQPVLTLIGKALPVTLLLNLIAIPLIYMIAIPSGILAATRAGSWFDIGSGALYVALWSIPVVWAGTLMIGFLANERSGRGWFPVAGMHDSRAEDFAFLPQWSEEGFQRGYLLDTLWHICLPVSCLVYGGFAVLSKQTRAAMLDNFNADYVRTAKAKGVRDKDVVMRHVFRNSLLPVITMFAAVFPAMLAGSVVVEKIFTIPGMGSLVLDAINLRDRELLLADTLMIAGVNLFALLIADILYALADPRVTYD